MLHLASETSAAWLPRAACQLDEVLLDLAHGGKKSADAASKLLFSYPQHPYPRRPKRPIRSGKFRWRSSCPSKRRSSRDLANGFVCMPDSDAE